jgi:hypothetical protein
VKARYRGWTVYPFQSVDGKQFCAVKKNRAPVYGRTPRKLLNNLKESDLDARRRREWEKLYPLPPRFDRYET